VKGRRPLPARAPLLALASAIALALSTALAATLAGCGVGEGEQRAGGAELRVTRDFGATLLRSSAVARVRDGQTVMRLLEAKHAVETRYGGRFVESIDGLSASARAGRRDWFYFVNGIEAGVGATERELAVGDVIQWDYHRWDAAMRIPAIVGAYPEPFVHGADGKRIPTRLECGSGDELACREVERRLSGVGVRVTRALLASAGGSGLLRVIVARWAQARRVRAAATLARGPSTSGVFARFRPGGAEIELLDEAGQIARAAPRGSGLVAATAGEGDGVVWIVTGVDRAGVEAAAAALDPRRLRDSFAIAATPRGTLALPLRSSTRGASR